MSRKNRAQRRLIAAEATAERRDYTISDKQRWFSLYSNQKRAVPSRTITEFLETLPDDEPKPSKATMGRIIQLGIEQKWAGYEEIGGRCPEHLNVHLKDGKCEVCNAMEVLKHRNPEEYRRMKSEELAARAYPMLEPGSPLQQFIASDLPISSYVHYFPTWVPNSSSPETATADDDQTHAED